MDIGMKKLAPPALAAGPNTAFLNGVPDGEVHGFDVEFASTGISTGAAFNFVNPEGTTKKARGSDDLDKLIAFIFAAAGLSFSVDGSHKNLDGMDVQRWRSLLSFVLGLDFYVSGLCVDGTQVPISTGAAAALTFGFYLPLSLLGLFEDGDQWVQGSERVKQGYIGCNVSALSGNAALTGGNTMTITACSWTIHAHVDELGDKGTVGNDWTAEDLQGQGSDNPPLPRASYAVILDDDPTYVGTYTTESPVTLRQVDRTAIVRKYNTRWNRSPALGLRDNSCARATPIAAPKKPGLPFHQLDLAPRVPKIKNDSGNTQRLLVFKVQPASAAAQDTVSTTVGGGGTTHAVAKSVATSPAGQVPSHLVRWVARSVRKGPAPAGAKAMR